MDDARAHLPVPVQSVLGGKYRVDRLLGRGGFGAVYQGTQLDLGRQVAIKVLHQASLDPGTLARFQREARATGALGHPHIVQVTDFQLGDPPFLVMEYLPGESLADVLTAQGRLPPQRAVRIILQVLSALAAAHRIGIVHRDIKPANLLLVTAATNDDFLKVLDFGIAKDLSATGTQATQSGAVMGTIGYMAPEQAFGLSVDARADIYAAGGVLYRMLAGVSPIQAETMGEMMRLLANGVIVPLEQRDPTLPPQLCAAVARALAHDPEARFPDAESFARDVAASINMPAPTWTGAPRMDAFSPQLVSGHGDTSVDRYGGGATRVDPGNAVGSFGGAPRMDQPSSLGHAIVAPRPPAPTSSTAKVLIVLGAVSLALLFVGVGALFAIRFFQSPAASESPPPPVVVVPGPSSIPVASALVGPVSSAPAKPIASPSAPATTPKVVVRPTSPTVVPSAPPATGLPGKCVCQEPNRGRSLCQVRKGKSVCNCVGGGDAICVAPRQVGPVLSCAAFTENGATQGAHCSGNPVRAGKTTAGTVSGTWSCHTCDPDTVKYSGSTGASCQGYDDTLGTITTGTLSCSP